jgi:hypothetical protein
VASAVTSCVAAASDEFSPVGLVGAISSIASCPSSDALVPAVSSTTGALGAGSGARAAAVAAPAPGEAFIGDAALWGESDEDSGADISKAG